jgi:hypothetical protein
MKEEMMELIANLLNDLQPEHIVYGLIGLCFLMLITLSIITSALRTKWAAQYNLKRIAEAADMLDCQAKELEAMLVATKFLTLRPEVFASEHSEKEKS